MTFVKQYLKENLSEGQKRLLRKTRYLPWELAWRLVNPFQRWRFRRREGLRLHVGCGNARLDGFVNIDVRYTPAVDVTADLNRFCLFHENVDVIFSNAFFEHLYRQKRVVHLQGAFRALSKSGIICYIGIPNFPVVARSYLDKAPGTVGGQFDLFHAYRYTHGDPEQAFGWYLEQLHKSLFDRAELENLLRQAGFTNFVIFEYAFPGDAHPLPVNLGFFATRNPGQQNLQTACREFLRRFPDQVGLDSLAFL